jgi:uncharacterized protein YciI
MTYYLLEYTLVDDYLERRGEFRTEHLEMAQAAQERGDMVLAGALADPTDRALLVFRTDDPAAVEDFARNDPYVRHGLVRSWVVRRWTVVIGDGAAPVLPT